MLALADKIWLMNNDVVGTATYKLTADPTQLQSALNSAQSSFKEFAETSKKESKSLSDGLLDISLGAAALSQSFDMLSGTADIINGVVESYQSYQSAMNGVRAVASATGNSIAESMQVVKDATANGLLSQTDAAAAVKNLELYGYTAQQAGEMIRVMTDSAVYNRQAQYTVSEAVRATTEGIRMENSELSDAAGITKNIAKMQEEYADELGVTYTSLTQSQKAQAVYNGVLAEGGIFAGNAADYTNTLAGAQSKLDTSLEQVRSSIGQVSEAFAPVVSGIANWVSENRELVAGLMTFAGIIGAGGALITGIVMAIKAINAIRAAIVTMGIVSKAAVGGLVGLATAAAAIGGAVVAANAFNSSMDETTVSLDNSTGAMGDNQQALEELEQAEASYNDTLTETSEQIADLNKQIAKLTRDYRRDLKQILVDHEETIADLTTQIEEANVDYKRAIDERMAEFNVTMAEQERSHQETVDELMTQLAFLQRYNNEYNQQKLAQVQFALAKEKTLYQQETQAQKEQLALQNAADAASRDARLASLQAELADEIAFMQKHREDLNAVRDVILLDEVESLKERYLEQKASLEAQVIEAANKGKEAADAYYAAYNKVMDEQNPKLRDKMKTALSFLYTDDGVLNFSAYSQWKGLSTQEKVESIKNQALTARSGGSSGVALLRDTGFNWSVTDRIGLYARGGFTGRGDPDDIAGFVHKGEYVIPADYVDQVTGLPETGGSVVQNVTINLSGTFATSPAERRKVAQQIAEALAQVSQTRLA